MSDEHGGPASEPVGDIWDTDDAWASDAILGRDITQVPQVVIGKVVETAGDPNQAFTWRCPEWPRAERAVNRYLRDLQDSGVRPLTLRSYAMDLQRWLRYLRAVDIEFDQATLSDYFDFRRFLAHHGKTRGARRPRRDGFEVRNQKTGKVHADDHAYALSSLQHMRSVIHEWYDFLFERSGKPLVNPIPHSERRERSGDRRHAHHNPLDEFVNKRTRLRDGGRRPNQQEPRHMPDDDFDEFWDALTCHRDRALVKVQVDSAARPSELLGVTWDRVDWGTPSITVERKGTQAEQTIPISAEAAVWLRRHQQESGYAGTPTGPVFTTMRSPRRPLSYNAYRSVLNRLNQRLGTDWTPHDLRHTAAVRMLDAGVDARYVQEILGHADMKTLAKYTRPRVAEIVRAQQVARSRPRPEAAPSAYEASDLTTLFGPGA